MSSFTIKIIAIISMLLDHSGDVFLKKFTFLNILGRIAFPLFAFQLVVGYYNTKSIKKYLFRLLLFALISQIPFGFFNYYAFDKSDSFNIFFTLAFGILVMLIADYQPKLEIHAMVIPWFVKVVLITFFMLSASALNTDYGAWGVLLILLIYLFYPYTPMKSSKAIAEEDSRLNKNNSIPNTLGSKANNKNIYKSYFDFVQNRTVVIEKAAYIKPALERLSQKSRIVIFILVMLFMMIVKYVSYINLKQFNLIQLSNVLNLVLFSFLPTVFMLLYNGTKGPSMKYLFYLFYPVHLILITFLAMYLA